MFPISPYELLRASIPKPTPTIVTEYDLYSTAQQSVPLPAAHQNQLTSDAAPSGEHDVLPRRKTHYVSDIKARHNHAARRITLQ